MKHRFSVVAVLALAAPLAADDYEVVDWLQALEGGGVSFAVSNMLQVIGNPELCGDEISLTAASGASVDFLFSWQRLEDGEWKQVPDTATSNRICGLAANGAPERGRYRATMDFSGGFSMMVASNAIQIGEAEEETAVEPYSWGAIKARVR